MPQNDTPVATGPLPLLLRAGAVYDWILAAAILSAAAPLMLLLRFPPPADYFHFRLSALPPLFFGILYWQAARDPRGRRWAVDLSILIRLAGGALLAGLALAHSPAGLGLYLAVAAIDLGWGVAWLVAGGRAAAPGSGRK